ncbi:hypothetical protein RhiirA5_379754 [Rhizophagus irregularis]|uniref:NrS-1 polymerase-like helicase domain-containing protein n=1 Tax=Rhizophagus irregularis TaxID=588596 RepID=A0A2N0PAX7_9GLOM|nr:hypothetical protein RhiirA5_379754 [Rhizophagus irregularis]
MIISYGGIYYVCVLRLNTDFFNLFLKFLAKPAPEINKEIIDLILWHVKNVICSRDERLDKYIWNWWAYLVQKPEKKSRSILVLKSTLQQCGKNIITDFIGDKVLGEHLYYTTSDLEKILKRFNSAIQAQKLIVMNETGMSSTEWHKFNGHLKSLITEGRVSIERKGIETKRIRDFTWFIVTSNQDAPLKIDIEDSCVVCFDVFSRCRGNTKYFKRLGKVLDHPDAPGVVMIYLLSRDLSDFKPEEIPATKMKVDIMRDQLPSPIRFIIDYITSRAEDGTSTQSCTSLYQKYLKWCGENGEKLLTSKVAGKKFSEIGIESKQVRTDDLPKNETTNIPIFNVLEIIPPKIIPHHLEKNMPSLSASKNKKADKQDDSSQVLFDYVATEVPVTSISGTSGTSKTSELSNRLETSKPSKPIEPISNVMKAPKPSSNEILSARVQCEKRLRKWVIEHDEDPDIFMTITEKDVDRS